MPVGDPQQAGLARLRRVGDRAASPSPRSGPRRPVAGLARRMGLGDRAAPRALRRARLPSRAGRAGHRAGRSDRRGRGRLRGDDRRPQLQATDVGTCCPPGARRRRRNPAGPRVRARLPASRPPSGALDRRAAGAAREPPVPARSGRGREGHRTGGRRGRPTGRHRGCCGDRGGRRHRSAGWHAGDCRRASAGATLLTCPGDRCWLASLGDRRTEQPDLGATGQPKPWHALDRDVAQWQGTEPLHEPHEPCSVDSRAAGFGAESPTPHPSAPSPSTAPQGHGAGSSATPSPSASAR